MSLLMQFDEDQISQMLPHKHPFLFLHKAFDVEPGIRGNGIRNVKSTDWYFAGHFPGNPIVPGVLIIESMAQLTAVIYISRGFEPGKELSDLAKRVGYLVKTDIKFLQPVRPDCELGLNAEIIGTVGSLSKVRVVARANSKIVAEGYLNVSENTGNVPFLKIEKE